MARVQFTAQVWDQKYKGKLLKHMTNRLQAIYEAFATDAATIGRSTGFKDPSAEFRFADFPTASKKMDTLLHEMGARITSLIQDGQDQGWKLSEDKNAAMVQELADRFKWDEKRVQEIGKRNVDGLKSFQARREKGLDLSQRVWNFVKNDKNLLEMALEMGLAEGVSAAELSRQVRGYLREPAKLFRRVRDKHGNLVLSKRAKAYHPGAGVYRSSYKNALRMTSTEVNMAYRSADYAFNQCTPWIIGQEIKTSPNHATKDMQGHVYPAPYSDMCDDLAGVYPKGFKFVGWHPHCRCFVVPKRASDKEIRQWAAKPKAERDAYTFGGQVKDMPKNYDTWISANQERIDRAYGRDTLPYFIRDNYVDGDPSKPLLYTVGAAPSVVPGVAVSAPTQTGRTREEILAAAKERQAARTQATIDAIQSGWNERRLVNYGLDDQIVGIKDMSNRSGVDISGYEKLLKKPGTETKKLVSQFKLQRSFIKNEFEKLYNDFKDTLKDLSEIRKDAVKLGDKDILAEIDRIMDLSYNDDDIKVILGERKNIASLAEKIASELTAKSAKKLTPNPALVAGCSTDAEIVTAFEKIGGKKWFKRGFHRYIPNARPGDNGSTDGSGIICMKPEYDKLIKSGLKKIADGNSKKITYKEAGALNSFWHEINHNKLNESITHMSTTERKVMELINEFQARKTLPEFYNALGCEVPFPEYAIERPETSYDDMVRAFDKVISLSNLDEQKVIESVLKNSPDNGWAGQMNTAVQALKDGGIKKIDGTALTDKMIEYIIEECMYSPERIEAVLRKKEIIK